MARRRGFQQRDVVEVIVQKLPAAMQKDISSNDIIVKTQEQLRLLRHKAPNNTLGKFDTEELRAACLLEFVYRKETSNRLCQKTISKCLGTKPTNFAHLHRLIGNYLEEPTLRTVTTRSNPRRTVSQSSAHARQVDVDVDFDQKDSIIPRLSIRLNSLIHDPNGFAVKAQNLFDDLLEYVEGLNGSRKNDQQTDIQRFRAAYEAACLYHVVSVTQTKQLRSTSTHQNKQKNRESSSQQQPAKTHDPKQRHDDDPNRGLEISDIIDASPEFTISDFKQVLTHVVHLVIEMEDAAKTKKAAAAKKRGAVCDSRKGSTKRTAISSKSKKRAVVASTAAAAQNSKKKRKGSNDEGGDLLDADKTVEVDIPSTQEWRHQVLGEARRSARSQLLEQNGTLRSRDITDSMLLASAADCVLRKFEVLA